MKSKRLLLLLLLALLAPWAVAQQNLPYTYGFENNNLATDGWTTQNPSGLNASEFGIYGYAANTGSYSFRFSSYNDYGANTQYLISPEMNSATGVTAQFYYKGSSSWGYETFKVGYSTTNTELTSFNFDLYEEISTEGSTSWTLSDEFIFPAGTKYVAVYYYANYQYRLYVDDFSFTATSPCAKPTDLAIDYTEGATTATVTWSGDASAYNIDVNGTVTENVTSPYTITPLTPATTYTVKVQADCGEYQSGWANADSFTTPCPETFAIPYAYGFEDLAGIDCWTVDADGGIDNSEPQYAHTGNNFFIFSYTTAPPQYLVSPELSGIVNGLHVEFYYRQYTSGVETFQVGYSSTFDPEDPDYDSFVWGTEITASTTYQRFSANYPASTKYVAIKHTANNQYYLFIDDFLFEESASCLEPTNVLVSNETTTGATVSWTPAGEETAWDIYVTRDASNVPNDATTPTYSNVNTHTGYEISGLSSATTYYVYVRALCGETPSAWSSPAIFNTACEAMALPYTYGFEDEELPVCWNTIVTNTSYTDINIMTPSTSSTNQVLAFYRGTSASDAIVVAILPEIDASYPLNGYQITFDACYANATYGSMTNGKLGIGIMTDPADFTTFELIEEVEITNSFNSSDSNLGLRSHTVMFNKYTGTGGYIAIQDIHTQNGYVLVDNIEVTELPSCLAPTALAATTTTSSAELSWTDNNETTPAGWTIYYKKTTEETYTPVPNATNPYVLNGLDAATEYTFYVVANCSETDESDPSLEFTFATECEAIVVDIEHPFTEGFEGETFAPTCWENIPSGYDQWSKGTSYVHSGSAVAYSGFYGDIYLVMPDLQLSSEASGAQLTFWSYNSWSSDYDKNSVVLFNGEEEIELWSPESVTSEWVETTIDLSAYVGQTISLAFKYEGSNAHGWYLDDVEVSLAPVTTVTVPIALTEGWNWISLPIEVDDPAAALLMLEEALDGNALQIKARTGQSTEYDDEDEEWFGTLTGLSNENMYMILMANDYTISLEGLPADPASHQITINPGWNWIGFPSNVEMSVEDAFADFEAEEDDELKSRDGSISFDGEEWFGSLTLTPGQGYMYNFNGSEPTPLVIPSGAKARRLGNPKK